EQILGVAEMTVGRGRTDTGEPRGLGDGEAGGPLLGNQMERRIEQRLAQIAVMVTAPLIVAAWSRPAHVNVFYISWSANPLSISLCSCNPRRVDDEIREPAIAALHARERFVHLRQRINPMLQRGDIERPRRRHRRHLL